MNAVYKHKRVNRHIKKTLKNNHMRAMNEERANRRALT